MVFQSFNPHEQLRLQNEKKHPAWIKLSVGLEGRSLDDLRELNANWFKVAMGFEQTAPMLWLVNRELTRRDVAPMWRGVPRFVKAAPLPAENPMSTEPRRIGDVAKKNLMKRWIDLEWLRVQLGPSHFTKFRSWQGAFAEDMDRAVAAFGKVNAIWSRGGGKSGTKAAHDVVDRLSIPRFHRLGLTGLIDRDAGEFVRNMEKRLKTRIKPLLEAQKMRAAYPLTGAEVERRLLYCQAIELAVGSPTDAAILFRWMTGERVTRQTMHEMRGKIADQCKLTTRAWRAANVKK